jgi:molybdenum cofactor cytidylyltransferase
MTPILILAAGKSSRMRGGDKMREDVDGVPLLRRQTSVAVATKHHVFVALAPHAPQHLDLIADLDATPLFVADAAAGVSGTLRGAIPQLPRSGAFMIMLADLVALTTQDLLAVLSARTTFPDHLIWRGATSDGQAGHPILIDDRLRPEFAKLSGDEGGQSFLGPLHEQTHLVTFVDQRARLDLDTPEDWATWRSTFS